MWDARRSFGLWSLSASTGWSRACGRRSKREARQRCQRRSVSERRARLLGLDEPTDTRTEISGSLSVDAERRLKAEVEDLQRWLSFEELRELGEKSERLFADARALVQARRRPMLVAVSPSPAGSVDDVATGEPAEQPAGSSSD